MAKENVIFISTHSVQMIVGSCDKADMIKIIDFCEVELDEGVMINGVITDDIALQEALSVIHAKGITHARIVIDSGQILVKNLEVPVLKHNEMMHVVQDELSNLNEGYEDLIYDYSVLQQDFKQDGKTGGEILCCAVERKLIASYLEVFEAAGIKIDSIDISVNALHKLTAELNDLEHKTYIVSVLDANNVSSYLFENNRYTFSNRTRLFSERGSIEFITEMSSNISQLIQFSRSKHSPYPIETAYFCGLHEEEEEQIFQNIRASLDIEANIFPSSKIVYVSDQTRNSEFELHDYVFSVGCMIRK